jgi:Uncharacterized protein related to plant photosystem II stability/assembly factor
MGRMRCVFAALVVSLLAAWAQSPVDPPAVRDTALENSGKPMLAPFQCTEEDIQSFGLGCSEEEPCPIFLELSAFATVGNQLFVAGNIHSASSTLYSILLASADGGKTWREPFTRIRGASLDQIVFIDFEHGWIPGQIVNPLARDPFLLITGDGGKTWRRVSVFEDSRAGSIQRLWFDSRNAGTLIFDRGVSGDGPRYELYETATGGDNWMVREASDQPIQPKRAPLESEHADWRLRPDAATKSNRIEKRQAGRWSAVASFAVGLAPCTPPQVKEPEPPPENTAPETAKPTAPGTLSLPALRGEPAKKPKK